MTDQEIYEGIARKDNATFLYLYKTYKDRIISLVKRNSGNEDDALDIFQEGLIALWTNITQGKFEVKDKSKIGTYLYALCRNIWISRLRKTKRIDSIDDNPGVQEQVEVDDLEEGYEQVKLLERMLGKLGNTCQKLLKLFYYQKAPLKEIAVELSITEKTAKNNKYRCMQNLRTIFKAENSTI